MENVRYQRQSAEFPGSATNAADHRDLFGQLLCHFVAVLQHSEHFVLCTFGTFQVFARSTVLHILRIPSNVKIRASQFDATTFHLGNCSCSTYVMGLFDFIFVFPSSCFSVVAGQIPLMLFPIVTSRLLVPLQGRRERSYTYSLCSQFSYLSQFCLEFIIRLYGVPTLTSVGSIILTFRNIEAMVGHPNSRAYTLTVDRSQMLCICYSNIVLPLVNRRTLFWIDF